MGRLVALPLLLAVAACLYAAWTAFESMSPADDPESVLLIGGVLAILLLVLAAACALGVFLALTGRLGPSRANAAPAFGRQRTSSASPRLLPLRPFLLLSLVALIVAITTLFLLGEGTSPGDEPIDPPQVVEAEQVPPAAIAEVPDAPPEPPAEVIAEAPDQDEPEPPPAVNEPPPPVTVAQPPEPEMPPAIPGGHSEAVVWLSVSPDGRSLLSASVDHSIKLWDLAGEMPVRDVGQHKDMARVALFLPDGRRALTAGDDGEIVLRAIPDGKAQHVFSAPADGSVRGMALGGDGRYLVSAHESGRVYVWDIDNKTTAHRLEGHDWPVNGIAVSPEGGRAVTGDIDGVLKLWDIAEGRLLRTWKGHERGVYGAAFTPDGLHVVTGSGDYSIKLWNLETGEEERRFDGHSGTVYAIALSSDGSRIASASLDRTARLWEIATGREIMQFNGHLGALYSVDFLNDTTVLTGGNDATIRVWPVDGGPSRILSATPQ